MGNFDFLLNCEQFKTFSNDAMLAEQLVSIDSNSSIAKSRVVLENATKWLYSVDSRLNIDDTDGSIFGMLKNENFQEILKGQMVDEYNELYNSLHYIRRTANQVLHKNKKTDKNFAIVILNYLFVYLDWIDQTFNKPLSTSRKFDRTIPLQKSSMIFSNPKDIRSLEDPIIKTPKEKSEILAKTKKEILHLKKNLTPKVIEQFNENQRNNESHYISPTSNLTEAETRQYKIDFALEQLGWRSNKKFNDASADLIEEYMIEGVESSDVTSGSAPCDYALMGDDGKVLAIIEAKRQNKNVEIGRVQALQYAQAIAKKQNGFVPFIFLSNGREIIFNDHMYGERIVADFFSKSDLQSLFYKATHKIPKLELEGYEKICERPYQKEALARVCEHFNEGNRKALVVMATGTGKTRVVLALIKMLCEQNWVKNVLFLADRTSLVKQAFKAAKNLLLDFPCANLCAEKPEDRNVNARLVFSTYQTMITTIDEARSKDGFKIFSPAHFDLVIIDEAHRSIYNRYKNIFNYFDSFLVGLTATPKKEIDRNTYNLFDLEDNDPTFYYDIKDAVNDRFLVDFNLININSGIVNNGITYDKLSDEDKDKWNDYFSDEKDIPNAMSSADINRILINRDTIRKVLASLFEHGIKVDNGDKIGKTIIFAKNHAHAEEIKKVFDSERYTKGTNECFCSVIDYSYERSGDLIEYFKDNSNGMNSIQIAISVDMLDTGIDVPECVNLVFFKKVLSITKFYQMIGRGTRLCPNLFGPNRDKTHFTIFDVCSNFEFFKVNGQDYDRGVSNKSLECKSFNAKLDFFKTIQDNQDYSEEVKEKALNYLIDRVNRINKDSFLAKIPNNAKAIEILSDKDNYKNLSIEELQKYAKDVGSLIMADAATSIVTRRFDYLIECIILTIVKDDKKHHAKYANKLKKYVSDLKNKLEEIPEIGKHRRTINHLMQDGVIENLSYQELEKYGEELRLLVGMFTSSEKDPLVIDVPDTMEITRSDSGVNDLAADDFIPYKERVRSYLTKHKDVGAVYKIHNNLQLDEEDVKQLENILWKELGTKEEYENNYSNKNLGVLVRQVVGLDHQAAQSAFSKFIDDNHLNANQMHFVNEVIKYVQENGLVEDVNILVNSPLFKPLNFITIFEANTLRNFVTQVNSLKEKASI